MSSIPSIKLQPLPPSLDTDFLRQEARGHLEQWASANWTDFNTHDPGITILEMLAYAITDLGFRTNLDIEQIFAAANKTDFVTASQVLPNAAYTPEDLRRILIDQADVRNAWVSSTTRRMKIEAREIEIGGLYEPLIDLEAVDTSQGKMDLNEYWLKDVFTHGSAAGNRTYDYYVMFPDWDNLADLLLWSGEKNLTEAHLKQRENPNESPVVLPEYAGNKIWYYFDVLLSFGEDPAIEKAFWIHLPVGIPEGNTTLSDAFKAEVAEKVGKADFYLRHQQRARLRKKRLDEVRSFILQHRNLAEDVENISTIKYQFVGVKIEELQVRPEADPVQVLAEIYFAIQQFIEPHIHSYSFDTLRAAGKAASVIFEGPRLEHGFIPEEALSPVQRKDKLYASDLIRLIMETAGVIAVKGLTINLIIDGLNRAGIVSNCLTLIDPELYKPRFSFDDSAVNVFKRTVPVYVDRLQLKFYWEKRTNEYISGFSRDGRGDFPVPLGEDVALENYYSIQEEFPRLYGLREGEITSSMSELRKAQAKQLKAYLLFFEQVMANYCSQLAQAHQLFSMRSDVERTDFYQPLYAVPAVQELYAEFVQQNNETGLPSWEEFTQTCNQYIKRLDGSSESRNMFLKRRGQFIDHLLARFAENMSDYESWAYAKNGGANGPDIVFDKLNFLQNLPALSSQRAVAFSYSAASVWDSSNMSGFEKRVAAKLGMPDCRRRSLSDIFNLLDYVEYFDERDAVEENPPRTEARFRLWNAKTEDVYKGIPVEERNPDLVDRNKFQILLSSTKHYLVTYNPPDLTPPELRNELVNVLTLAKRAANYSVHQVAATTPTCQYYFNLLGSDLNEEDPIARRIEYFSNRAETENEIRKLIHLAEGRHTEGMHLIEHIRLRPVQGSSARLSPVVFKTETYETTFIEDPYSFQVSIFFPGWAPRFCDPEFRAVLERTLREEMPATIFLWLYWVEPQTVQTEGGGTVFRVPREFTDFETSYRKWLQKTSSGRGTASELDQFIKAFNKLTESKSVTLTNSYQILH